MFLLRGREFYKNIISEKNPKAQSTMGFRLRQKKE
jgi:hypothetical protein